MYKNNCQELLLTSLNDFYNKNYKFKILFKNIITGNHKLSLRLIDWLVTHYSKNYNIIYWIYNDDIFDNLPDENLNYKKINLYLEYRAQLKSYAKLNFDTFRRHERITFFIDDNDSIETTIGQLNFFRWIFNNNVITYAINNYDSIYNNMITNNNFKKNNIKISNYQEISKSKSILRFD
tara:strand:+ start:2435 stop:2971 length:537 start_codon:yes stop_codon:yes gene_type:complete